ncbi:MAG TPA: c-type cytochrome domain-containing protein, partial [Pirellulales bacterium]
MHRFHVARLARCLRIAAVLALICGGLLSAPAPAQETEKVDFLKHVQPILTKRCFACHGPDKQEGGLRLTNRDAATMALESGEHAILAGEPD